MQQNASFPTVIWIQSLSSKKPCGTPNGFSYQIQISAQRPVVSTPSHSTHSPGPVSLSTLNISIKGLLLDPQPVQRPPQPHHSVTPPLHSDSCSGQKMKLPGKTPHQAHVSTSPGHLRTRGNLLLTVRTLLTQVHSSL